MTRIGRLVSMMMLGVGIAAAASAADVIELDPLSTGLEIELGESEILHLRVSEVSLDRIEIDGDGWAVVRVPEGHNLMDRGRPSLPYLVTEYLLGRTGGVALELVGADLMEIDLASHGLAGVVPSKGHIDRGTDPDSVPWVFDEAVYAGTSRFPDVDSWADRPFITGPLRGQALRIPVVHWRPDTNILTVIEEARFRVVRLAEAENPRIGPDRPLTGLFDAAARLRAINYEAFRDDPASFAEAGRLLVIADDGFLDEVGPFADWQTLVGYPTMVVPTSVAGSSAGAVKSYIQSVYDEPAGLTWIVLVGDSDQIDSPSGVYEGATCDPCYTKLEGDDNRPDAAISRISSQTPGHVAVQVSKILDYEQLPDTGSAGAWYRGGFGIAGDDTGGTGLADWQRMDLLRTDLMDPNYNYTEFDQLYHYPSKTAVADAINDGRSLGLYIGHGSDTSWSTSGFSVSDINTRLTNDGTLPVIWSVACVNGRFDRAGGDCFGEAWLKKDGGGAVSFEGATTNESWVPPCDAQRGIVDALRLETALTTGGQHMAGKQAVMDIWGDSNHSEGTKWVEQSTLFGACTTWMRTGAALAPEEPTDYAYAAGVASLTVVVDGSPLARPGAAIVSFYDEVGGVNVLGSGLIDGNGVVTASVSGEPTHCHIHGQNLIPTSYQLEEFDADPIFADNFESGDCGRWGRTTGGS